MNDRLDKIETAAGAERWTENKGHTAHPIHQIQGTPTPPGEPATDVQPSSQPAPTPNEPSGD
jgi:hypothetical protein